MRTPELNLYCSSFQVSFQNKLYLRSGCLLENSCLEEVNRDISVKTFLI